MDTLPLSWIDGGGTVVGQGDHLDLAGLSVGVHVLRIAAPDPAYGGSIGFGTFDSSAATVTVTGNGTETPAEAATEPDKANPIEATLGQLSAPITTVQTTRVRNLLNQVQTRLRTLRAGASTPAFDAPGVSLPDISGGKDEDRKSRRLGAYVMGLGDYLRNDANTSDAGFKVNTKSLMLGADYRLNGSWVVGGALGISHTDVRFDGGSQSRQDSDGYSGTAYASWSLTPSTYVSATLSYEASDFDIARDNGGSSILRASTKGHGLGLSLSAGHDIVVGAWSFSPYVRWDSVTARIHGFDEVGGVDAVSVSSQRSRSDTLNIGSQVQYSIPVSWGVVLPHARVEFTRRTDSHQNSPSARLLNGNTALLIPTSADTDRSYGNWAIGVSSITQRGVTLFCDYEAGFALQGYRSQRITVGLRSEL
ncbi:MAG TPA: autotransporter outer membrane beta-barrel domain-containing protein [Burkholderiaceae bacterium]|nr:autotransporter outer membrane beta-barrel domain-containing protein [Burkholderiaceae bacterium]